MFQCAPSSNLSYIRKKKMKKSHLRRSRKKSQIKEKIMRIKAPRKGNHLHLWAGYGVEVARMGLKNKLKRQKKNGKRVI